MERPTRVNYQGVERDAVEVDFKIVKEDWNEYNLDDGTRIKLKPVATVIIRIPGVFDSDGNPIYMVKSSNVMAVSAAANLKKEAEESSGVH
jgi:hypothetical protein